MKTIEHYIIRIIIIFILLPTVGCVATHTPETDAQVIISETNDDGYNNETGEDIISYSESQKDLMDDQSETMDRFGFVGLYDTKIAYIHGKEPSFSQGITLKEVPIYPAPNEELYELGYIYPGRTVEVIRAVNVGTYDDGDMMSGSVWYLLSAGTYNTIGYAKAGDIENAETVSAEPAEPWQVKAGAVYYMDRSCTTRMIEDYPIGPLWIQGKDEERHIWRLDGFGGLTIYINDPNVLEMFPGLGRSRNSRAG